MGVQLDAGLSPSGKGIALSRRGKNITQKTLIANATVFGGKVTSRSRPLKLATSVITVVHMAASLRRSRYGIGPALLREAGPAPGGPGGTARRACKLAGLKLGMYAKWIPPV